MKNEPKVICLCCTYNRPDLLGESIKCFIDQDYKNKKLIILNDQEGVNLKLDSYDNIQIYNHPKRFDSLGAKRNYIKTLDDADYYCIWDDDDLYMPFRISESVYFALKSPDYDIIKPKDAFVSVDNVTYKVATNRFHAQAIVTRKYMQNNDYPLQSIGEDKVFEDKAKMLYVEIYPSIWSIFRWGMNTYHISSIADDKESWKRARNDILKGDILIKAEFQKDYWEDIRKAYNDINGFWGEEFIKKISKNKKTC